MSDHESVVIHDDGGRPWNVRRQRTIKVVLKDGNTVSMYINDARRLVAEDKATWPEGSSPKASK